MKADSYAKYQAAQKSMGTGIDSPAEWWGSWLSEHDRAELILCLPEDRRKYAREYGLTLTWKLIIPAVQKELLALA